MVSHGRPLVDHEVGPILSVGRLTNEAGLAERPWAILWFTNEVECLMSRIEISLFLLVWLMAACDGETLGQTDPGDGASLDVIAVDTAVDAHVPTDSNASRDAQSAPDMNSVQDALLDSRSPDSAIGNHPDGCRIGFSGGSAVGVGFPTPNARLQSIGVVRATILFAEFADVTSDRTPEEVFQLLSPGAEAFFTANSYGRMDLILDPHLVWLPLQENAAHYAAGLTSFAGHRAFMDEAVRAADPAFDFSSTDVVVVMAAPNAQDIGYGPTWMGIPEYALVADGRAFTNGVTSGADLLFWGSQWLNHELGHSMGLPDLYSFDGPDGFTRPFSVMDLINSSAPEFLAWERWQLGWLDDDQIICDGLDSEIQLTPIESIGGLKAAMVRSAGARVVVVESRRAIGYDIGLQDTGVVVSLVDGALPTGRGIIEVMHDRIPLTSGQSVVVDGVQVEVVSRTSMTDTVRLTRL